MKKKFGPALQGLRDVWQDPSIRLQILLALAAVCAGFILQLSEGEWLAVLLACGLVIAAEILNTCVERLCNLYTEEDNAGIRIIKDLAAAAVLCAAFAALAAALVILAHHI
jgi:diacylglycerol kinase